MFHHKCNATIKNPLTIWNQPFHEIWDSDCEVQWYLFYLPYTYIGTCSFLYGMIIINDLYN